MVALAERESEGVRDEVGVTEDPKETVGVEVPEAVWLCEPVPVCVAVPVAVVEAVGDGLGVDDCDGVAVPVGVGGAPEGAWLCERVSVPEGEEVAEGVTACVMVCVYVPEPRWLEVDVPVVVRDRLWLGVCVTVLEGDCDCVCDWEIPPLDGLCVIVPVCEARPLEGL